jgi:hypothetical protein
LLRRGSIIVHRYQSVTFTQLAVRVTTLATILEVFLVIALTLLFSAQYNLVGYLWVIWHGTDIVTYPINKAIPIRDVRAHVSVPIGPDKVLIYLSLNIVYLWAIGFKHVILRMLIRILSDVVLDWLEHL